MSPLVWANGVPVAQFMEEDKMLALKSTPIQLREKPTAPVQSKRNDRHPLVPQENRTQGSFILDPWKVAIARLTNDEMKQLPRYELIHLTTASRVFSGRSWVDQLGLMDREGLELLAVLVRQSFRHDVNAVYREWEQPIPCWNNA